MSWKSYLLGDILKRKRAYEKIIPEKEYKLVTIRLYHKGICLRSTVKGVQIKSSMASVKEGDFILSGIDARNGAFGIVPKELDGAIVTNDFWCLEPDEKIIDKEFLLFLTSTDFFDHICKQSSDGTTQRIRLQKEKFFNFKVDLPFVNEQKVILAKLKFQQSIKAELSTELTHQFTLVKKLRQQLLQDAVQGKLVEQNPTDEPASELLKKIKAEKEKLIAEKKLKKEKELPPIKPSDIPFEIPENWEWCRLGEICTKVTDGFHNTPKKLSEGKIYISATHIREDGIKWSDCLYVSEKDHKELFNKAYPKRGEILITNRGAGCSTPVIIDIDEEFSFQNAALIGFNQQLVSNRYLFYFILKSRDEIMKTFVNGGLQPMLSNVVLGTIPIPFPPLAEQTRIVQKLDELMQHCNALEASIKQSELQNEKLLQQVLREALRKEELSVA
jgi:type I restriction enzyme, S subunit